MTLHRTSAAGTAAVTVVLALVAVPVTPARAHGATTDPISRVAACGPQGGARQSSAACRAALEANGGADFAAWDNLRLADVAGRDRARIPDGQLCSAGKPEYRGLDLPRADWPSTRLAPGQRYTFRYRGTIPHQGSFRLYLTTDSYTSTRPLRWSDLDTEPFLTVVDPPLRGGSYQLTGRLPADRSGRHLIYAIWRNTDAPDTYYSCSDVVFPPGEAGSAPGGPAGTGSAKAGAGRPAGTPAAGSAAAGGAGGQPAREVQPLGAVQPANPDGTRAVVNAPAEDGHGPLVVAGLAAVLAVGTAVAGLRRSRRNRQRS